MNGKSLLLAVALAPLLLAQPPGGPGGGGTGATGDGIWRRNAAFGEAQTFDYCLGHQPGSGAYHYHVNPICLRAQLNDNLVALKTSRNGTTWQEKSSGWAHSPILGWAQDGYPIYGPYGYSDPKNPASPVRRMVSSYQLRSITTRTSLPTWSLPNHTGISQQLTASQYGPAVSATYPLGRYLEDYDYIAGLGDLDQYNGRFTVTPDFPSGTYAYFVTIDSSGNPAFPYVIAGQYYGAASGGQVTSVTGTVTDYFDNSVYTQSQSTTPELAAWATSHSTQFGKIVSGWEPAAGAVTSWPGTVPTGATTSGSGASIYAEIQRIRYSASAVYVNANDMPGYSIGPWFGFQNNGGVFPNFPSSQNLIYQFPLSPAPATSLTSTGGGACGLWVNGVEVFNFIDGASYSSSAGEDEGGGIATPSIITVSNASFEGGPVTPNSIVAGFPIFNPTLATSTASAAMAAWPTTLGGASITVKDSAGTTRNATIGYASPSQINYLIPAGTASGIATVTVSAGGSSATGGINVVPTYPNLFTQNSAGFAAGYTQSIATGQVTQLVAGQPVTAGTASSEVQLTIFGSGLNGATSVSATIGGQSAQILYAGAQGTWTGLDQYNLIIPPSLAGQGQVAVVVTAAGVISNTVYITIQ